MCLISPDWTQISPCFWELSWYCCTVICQPSNSFRARLRTSEWIGSSATPSDCSLFGRTYGTGTLRLSSGLTSEIWQRRLSWFPYSKFCFHTHSANFFGSSVHIRALFVHPDSWAFCSSPSRWPWQEDLLWQSLFQSWHCHGPCAGSRRCYSLLLPAFMFWLDHCEAAESLDNAEGQLDQTPATSLLYNIVPNPLLGKERDLFLLFFFFLLKTTVFCNTDMRGKG